jgi:hypothetical protein
MGTLFQEMLEDMDSINNEFGRPYFTWNGSNYQCVASVADFKNVLEDGGFQVDQLLTATVNRYTEWGQPIFPNDIIPASQQLMTFNGNVFRIQSVSQSSVFGQFNGSQTNGGATIKIMAVCPNKGI